LVTDEGSNQVNHLDVEEVVPKAIWAHHDNIALLNIVDLGVCLGWVIATGAYLEGEIKAVLLLLRAELCN
jgi:hypothetical protein